MNIGTNYFYFCGHDPKRSHKPPFRWNAGRRQVAGEVAVLAVLFWLAMSSTYAAVSFLKAPEGAKQITISLAAVENPNTPHGYLTHRLMQPLEEMNPVPASIAEAYAGKKVSVFQIAALPDGTRYLVALNEDKGFKSLSREERPAWYGRIYRMSGEGDARPELVREGYQPANSDVTFPVELALAGIGATKVKKFRTELGYNLTSLPNEPLRLYSGWGWPLQVSGSQTFDDGKLTMTVTVPDEFKVTPETQVSLRLEAAAPGLPEPSATGKITDYLTLGGARFIVTAMEPDFSSATLALVSGNLEQTLSQQLQLGAQMPAFAQVDLGSRKTVTQADVLSRARNSSGIVFIFGDLASPAGRFGPPYGPPSSRFGGAMLPLRPEEVVDQLALQLKRKPVVVFVTRQIGLDFLYNDLRNQTPEYLVLADFADPLRTSFRAPQPMPSPWYNTPYGSQPEPSLRQLFNLPGNMLEIVAFDPQGKVVYVQANASTRFLPSLAEARLALESERGRH